MKELLTLNHLTFLLEGLKNTLIISLSAILLSIFFGTFLGLMRQSKHPYFRYPANIYIEVVRNLPNLLWIYIVFIIFKLNAFPAGIVSFTIFTSAAIGEILRGGIQAVPKGQIEAARSQGMTSWQTTTHILLPQAFKKMTPAIISQLTTVIKDTSLLYSVIALQDLTGQAQILMGKYYQANQVFLLYGFLLVIYYFVNLGLTRFSNWLSATQI